MSIIVNPFSQIAPKPENVVVTPVRISRLFTPLSVEGGVLAIYGERGMGKTLMLNYIASPPKDWRERHFQNHIFTFFNCQDTVIPISTDAFWLQATKQLERKLENAPIKEKCLTLLERVQEGAKLNHNDFHEVLDVAAGAGKHIVLVLDDFDCLIRVSPEHLENTRAFLQGFRSLTTRDSNKANIVFATRYSLQELCKPLSNPHYSAFDNGFTNYRLHSFNEKELLKLLERVQETDQPPFNSAERQYIAYLSGFHPRLTQIAAAEIFDQRIENSAPINNFIAVGERFRSEARPVDLLHESSR